MNIQGVGELPGDSFDYAIVGAGVSGLALACALAESRSLTGTILVVDDHWSDEDDRTLSYFSGRPRTVDVLARRVFDRLRFEAPGIRLELAPRSYGYRSIRGLDYRLEARRRLVPNRRVTLVRGRVTAVQDDDGGAVLVVEGRRLRARWAFDSRPAIASPHGRHDALVQRFLGWEIELDEPRFDPTAAVLFHFLEEGDDPRFAYVLPFTATRGLVQVVTFGAPARAEHLSAYLERILPGVTYRILRQEGGASLLTVASCPRTKGGQVIAIGVAGGLLRASTGYALTRILDDARGMVAALEAGKHPLANNRPRRAHRLFDGVFLHLVGTRGALLPAALAALFGRNPTDRVLRLLDERASFWDLVCIALSAPKRLFLGALFGWAAVRLGLRAPVAPWELRG
jgi:lycopene beta-cyclase